MNACALIKSDRYQALKQVSGVKSDFAFDLFVRSYYERNNKYPELDEIPGVDSRPYIENLLDLKENTSFQYTTTDKLLDVVQADSLEDALLKLNDRFRDKYIQLVDLGGLVVVDIESRPSEYNLNMEENGIDTTITPHKKRIVLSNMLYDLAKLQGIKFNILTDAELKEKFPNLITDAHITNAFVYNGEIYINVDNASMDAPIHELTHILLGSIRFTNPDLYMSLVNLVELLPDYEKRIKQYRDRTHNDVNEEIFVNEFAKFLSGLKSLFDDVPSNIIDNIMYDVKRAVDTMIHGTKSAKSLSEANLFLSSMKDLCVKLNSARLNGMSMSTLNTAAIHRRLGNYKEDLLRKGELIENCE